MCGASCALAHPPYSMSPHQEFHHTPEETVTCKKKHFNLVDGFGILAWKIDSINKTYFVILNVFKFW